MYKTVYQAAFWTMQKTEQQLPQDLNELVQMLALQRQQQQQQQETQRPPPPPPKALGTAPHCAEDQQQTEQQQQQQQGMPDGLQQDDLQQLLRCSVQSGQDAQDWAP
jgi:hypothetical protein